MCVVAILPQSRSSMHDHNNIICSATVIPRQRLSCPRHRILAFNNVNFQPFVERLGILDSIETNGGLVVATLMAMWDCGPNVVSVGVPVSLEAVVIYGVCVTPHSFGMC